MKDDPFCAAWQCFTTAHILYNQHLSRPQCLDSADECSQHPSKEFGVALEEETLATGPMTRSLSPVDTRPNRRHITGGIQHDEGHVGVAASGLVALKHVVHLRGGCQCTCDAGSRYRVGAKTKTRAKSRRRVGSGVCTCALRTPAPHWHFLSLTHTQTRSQSPAQSSGHGSRPPLRQTEPCHQLPQMVLGADHLL